VKNKPIQINTPEQLQAFFDKRNIECFNTVEIPVVDLHQWINDITTESLPNSHAATPRTLEGNGW
jgi:hypothetical protein